jgi:hypothetical protein
MGNATKMRSAAFSRRLVLRSFARTAAGVTAVLGTTWIGAPKAAAQTKASQKAVGYEDMPKGPQQCDGCSLFIAPASCKVVEGTIAPAGWCRMFVKKPA